MGDLKDLLYTNDHEWAKVESNEATVGITEFAVHQLGDITLVELPEVGEEVEAGETMGTVESVKAVSDLYAPLSGTVKEVNQALEDEPELVNEDPFGLGWMLKVELSDPDQVDQLLDAEAYAKHCSEGGAD
jgi:glycine cleavage system H protein